MNFTITFLNLSRKPSGFLSSVINVQFLCTVVTWWLLSVWCVYCIVFSIHTPQKQQPPCKLPHTKIELHYVREKNLKVTYSGQNMLF